MRFKPGDKAKIVGNTNDHQFDDGEPVSILVVHDYYYDAINKNDAVWCVRDCDLEPLEASPVQEEESRPSVKDYFDDINEAADQYFTSKKLFQYTQAVDRYADHLESTISNLRKELEELKKQKI